MIKADLDAARAEWITKATTAEDRQRLEESDFLRYKDDKNRFLDFHAFRHTRGVWLFEHHNANPREVQELLGVNSLALVDRYTQSMKITDLAVIERGPTLSASPKTPELACAVGIDMPTSLPPSWPPSRDACVASWFSFGKGDAGVAATSGNAKCNCPRLLVPRGVFDDASR